MMRSIRLLSLLAVLLFAAVAEAEEAWPESVASPDFLPNCAELLLANPVLFEGGGEIIREGDSWLALGVGTATLPKGRNAERAAWENATARALGALAEALWGGSSEFSESMNSGDHATAAFISFIRTERGGTLARSWEGGRWSLFGGNTLAVLRVITSPGHPILRSVGSFPVVSDTLDPAWRAAVLARPILRYGGVSAVVHEGKTWFLVAGCAQVPKKFKSIPHPMMGMAEDRARSEWERFSRGVQLQSVLEMNSLQQKMGDESVTETLSTETMTRTTGGARMAPVGMWLSDAGADWRLAAVFRLPLDGGAPEEHAYPLTRPSIPQRP